MKATATVYLNQDKSKAVAEGDKDAKFLLVKEGSEISDADVEKYDVAALVGGKKTVSKAEQHEVQHRDPVSLDVTSPARKAHILKKK